MLGMTTTPSTTLSLLADQNLGLEDGRQARPSIGRARKQATHDTSRATIEPPRSTAAFSYPLLEQFLAIKGLPLRPTYTIQDVASLFSVSARAIHDRVASGQLLARDLPGRAKFLPVDLEEFLQQSARKRQK